MANIEDIKNVTAIYDEKQELKQAYETMSKYVKMKIGVNLTYLLSKKIEYIKAILECMQDFNEKDNKKIINNIGAFVESLPKVYYNEGNPNNGRPYFDQLELIGDDTIQLYGFGSGITEDDLEYAKKLVDRFGKDVNADEHVIIEETSSFGMKKYTIHLWWD